MIQPGPEQGFVESTIQRFSSDQTDTLTTWQETCRVVFNDAVLLLGEYGRQDSFSDNFWTPNVPYQIPGTSNPRLYVSTPNDSMEFDPLKAVEASLMLKFNGDPNERILPLFTFRPTELAKLQRPTIDIVDMNQARMLLDGVSQATALLSRH